MPSGRIFRVFVSSTFADLSAERDALQRHVFPELRRMCARRGARFQAIDLRWGIRDEAGLDQRTIGICLDEIARCRRASPRPNFLAILGERYGWRPLPGSVDRSGWRALREAAAELDGGRDLLDTWYERDENAVPEVWTLRPRTGRDRDPERWSAIEGTLATLFGHGTEEGTIVPPLLSATELEIEAGLFADADAAAHVHCFFRSVAGGERRRENGEGPESARLLAALKKRIHERLGPHVHEYEVRQVGRRVSADHLRPVRVVPGAIRPAGNLCQDVFEALGGAIAAQLDGDMDPLRAEIEVHRCFRQERAEPFVGRRRELKVIATYLEHGTPAPLAFIGAGGSGKTALLAQAAMRARRARPGAVVIERFVGATAASTSVRRLLFDIAREIERELGATADEGEPPDLPAARARFTRALGMSQVDRPIHVFIDAVDQLAEDEGARTLSWLPTEWDGSARVVVSALVDSASAGPLRAIAGKTRYLAAMNPGEGRALLDAWLAGARRTLQPDQRRVVLRAFAHVGMPLYLKLLFEEARLWRSGDAIHAAPANPQEVIRSVIARLSSPDHHAPLLVSSTLAYLAAARQGLAEDELLDVLAADDVFFADFLSHAHHALPDTGTGSRQLPVAVWSRLQYDLLPYLNERGADGTSVIAFFHRQLQEEVAALYLGANASGRRWHRHLARYFGRAGEDRDPGAWARDQRALSELPYQERNGEMWTDLERTLCDLTFVEAKCAAGMGFDLVSDYDAALSDARLPARSRRRIREFASFVHAQAHLLTRHPELTTQQALNEPDGSAPSRAARRRANAPSARAYLVSANRTRSPCLATLTGHSDIVNACAVADDGRVIASASSDGSVKLWDPETGRELRTFRLPGVSLEAVTLAPGGGARIAAVDRDGGVWVWSRAGESPPVKLGEHRNAVASLVFSPDGRQLATASWDRSVCLWDVVPQRRALRTLRGKSKMYTCAFSPDGRSLATGDEEGILRLWDLRTGRERWRRQVHRDGIWWCAFGPRGEWILTSSEDGTLIQSDAANGEPMRAYAGHAASVWTGALSPDGRTVVSGSKDHTLRVWDVRSGRELAVYRGHEHEVWGVSFFPDGKRVVSAAWDSTLRIWDVEGAARRAAKRRKAKVAGAASPHGAVLSTAASSDGQLLAAGLWDGTVRVWDRRTGAPRSARAFTTSSWVLTLGWSPDGGRVLAGGFGGGVALVEADGGAARPIASRGGNVLGCTFSSAAPRFAWCSTDRLEIWELGPGRPKRLGRWSDRNQDLVGCAFTADPDEVVAARSDGKALVVRVDGEARELPELPRREGLNCIDVSPDGRRLVAGYTDGAAVVCELPSGHQLGALRGHAARVESARFSGDGARIVTSSYDRSVRVWRADGEPIAVLEGHRDHLQSACFTGDGAGVISACMDGTFRLWDAATGAELAQLYGPPDAVRSCAFSAGGRRIASAAHGGDAQVCDGSSGRELGRLRGHRAEILGWSVAGDRSARAVSASADGTLRLWDLRAGRTLRVLEGHDGPVSACAISEDGGLVVSGGRDGTVRIWSARGDRVAGQLGDWVRTVALSSDTDVLVAGGIDGDVRAFAASSGRELWRAAASVPALTCSLSAASGLVAVGLADGTVELRELRTGARSRALAGRGHVTTVAFSPDGRRVAAGGTDRELRVHEASTGALLLSGACDGAIHACAFSPGEGARVATASEDRRIRVWAGSAGPPLAEFVGPAPMQAVAWHPSGGRLAAGDALGGIHVLSLIGAGAGKSARRAGRAAAEARQRAG